MSKKLGKQSWFSNILRFVASSLTLNEFQFAGLTYQKNSHDGLQPVTMVSWQCHGLVIKQSPLKRTLSFCKNQIVRHTCFLPHMFRIGLYRQPATDNNKNVQVRCWGCFHDWSYVHETSHQIWNAPKCPHTNNSNKTTTPHSIFDDRHAFWAGSIENRLNNNLTVDFLMIGNRFVQEGFASKWQTIHNFPKCSTTGTGCERAALGRLRVEDLCGGIYIPGSGEIFKCGRKKKTHWVPFLGTLPLGPHRARTKVRQNKASKLKEKIRSAMVSLAE